MCGLVKYLFVTVYLLYINNGVYGQSDAKSSLAFVIDSTGSMGDDIEAVKRQANSIFNVVAESSTSQVEDFVLVEFNDPHVNVLTKTKNREEFKRKLDSLDVDGGGDCPEMALTGIQRALEVSRPGSDIYVFTDAYAKDEDKYETVKQLATDKGCRIIFIVSDGSCTTGMPYSPIYNNLAKERDGQVFSLKKSDIDKLLKYVKVNIKSRKVMIAKEEFTPGSHKFNYTVDSNLQELIVSVTGDNLKVQIIDPYGDIAETEELVKTSKISILKVVETKPGVYTAEVESDADGNLNVYGTNTLHFQHGFSRLQPTAIEETTLRPYPDEKSFLSVKVNVEGGNIQLFSIELYDSSHNLIEERLISMVNIDDQFYASTEAFVPPNEPFWIAIKGVDYKTKSIITRFGLTPVKPQEKSKDAIENKSPNVTVIGASEVHVEYEQPTELKCRISGYPKPYITWEDETGKIFASEETQIEIPYDYVSVIEIEKVDANKTFVCKAVNKLGEDKKAIDVLTRRTRYFDVLETPKDAVIEYYQEGRFVCRVDSAPDRAKIAWFREHKKIRNDDNYKISSDGTVLTIKKMNPKLDGNFRCIARNDFYKKGFKFRVTTTGIEKPQIEKVSNEIHAKVGSDATIQCKIIQGTPKPKINWYFRPVNKKTLIPLKGGEILNKNKLSLQEAGVYMCEAKNVGGADYHFVNLQVDYPPYIKKSKRIVRAAEGEEVILPCTVFGAPKPKVKWYFDGKTVNDKRLHHYGNHDLRFIAEINHSGEYRCLAINELGFASSEKITVYVVVPVTIDNPDESSYEIAVGQDLQLHCNAHGDPRPKIQWVYNSLDFEITRPLITTEPDNSLYLKRIQIDQEGYYTCTAKNSGSSANFTYTVKILAPPTIITEDSVKPFEAVVGDLVLRIPCKTIGTPAITTWEKDGYNIASGTDWYDIEKDGSLLIKNVDKAMQGFYTCIAENRMGSAMETYEVIVNDFPKPGPADETVVIPEGESARVPCPISHSGVDYVRWYKDGKKISSQTLNMKNFSSSDVGLYTCRVSDLKMSNDGNVLLEVGFKPKFVSKPETEIQFAEGIYAELDCSFNSEAAANVSWWHNGKALKETKMFYTFKMTSLNKGQYICLVKNQFGYVIREFNVASKECVIKVEGDFGANRPFIVRDKMKWASSGYIHIPQNNTIVLACPTEFNVMNKSEITARCIEGTTFKVEDHDYEYADLNCAQEFEPIILDTDERCHDESQNLFKIGYEVNDVFFEVFEVCFDNYRKQPSFAKYKIDPSLAGTTVEEIWYDAEVIPMNFDELYDCTKQNRWFRSLLGRPFNNECCFSRRQLVNVRDMLPGLPQLATYSNMNVFPFWSTCNSKNWDLVEQRIRKFVTELNYPLTIWSGIAGDLNLPRDGKHKYLTITDNEENKVKVPKYIWKVIQDPIKKASLAIVQINIPDLKQSKALQHILCRDICSDVPWMQRSYLRNVKYGLVFCCSIDDFVKSFTLNGIFDPDMNDVLL